MRLAGMMQFKRVVGVILLLSSSTAAHAVSITNRDEHDHKVTVIEGNAKADHVLKPSQALNGICVKGAPFVSTTPKTTSISSKQAMSCP